MIHVKFTEMAGLIELVQHLMEDLVDRSVRTSASGFSPWVALLEIQATHNLETVCREAQKIPGGVGYWQGGVGKRVKQISRDVRVFVVSDGSEELLMDLVAKQQKKFAKR